MEPGVYFVGAGPGDPDLITLKGRAVVEAAGTIVYAGSLVNPAILRWARPGAQVYDSSRMHLEEIVRAMADGYRAGHVVARLQSGDPSIFGAIREQIDALLGLGVPCRVIPGVSSFCAAAASLMAEYTLPGVSQTVVLTRAEGRTPVPPTEALASLAQHRASMAVFLSAGMIDRVASELASAYGPDCPAAVVQKASWPEEKTVIGTLSDMSDIASRGLDSTALILVGRFLAGGGARSKLYDSAFSHQFRKASAVGADADSICADAPGGAASTDTPAGEGAAFANTPKAGGVGFANTPAFGYAASSDTSALLPPPSADSCNTSCLPAVAAGHQLRSSRAELGIIALSRPGALLARRVAGAVPGTVLYLKPELATGEDGCDSRDGRHGASPPDATVVQITGRLSELVGSMWGKHDCILLIMSLGIAVRELAPHLRSKKTDPAVVVMDDAGVHAISLLSGHLGGANAWCARIARIAGATPVITTSTDVHGLPAFDLIAKHNDMIVEDEKALRRISMSLIEGRKVALLSDAPVLLALPPVISRVGTVDEAARWADGLVVISHRVVDPGPFRGRCLVLRPKVLSVGIGMKKNTGRAEMERAVLAVFERHGLSTRSIAHFATLDAKAREPGLIDLARDWGVPVKAVRREEVSAHESEFAGSEFVKRRVGVGAVAEPCAVLSVVDGMLIVGKTAGRGVTVAVALDRGFAVRGDSAGLSASTQIGDHPGLSASVGTGERTRRSEAGHGCGQTGGSDSGQGR